MSHSDEPRNHVALEIEKKDELGTSPPQQQADNTAAAGNASNEEEDKNNDQSVNEDPIKTLYKAALKDDWKTAYVEVFKRDPLENSEYLRARITEKEDTALHIAVAAESLFFAKKLVTYMEKDDLAIKNSDGDTAFFLVAAYGMVEVAEVMFKKNDDLPGICSGGDEKMLPIHIAAQYGHKKMIEFLRGVTKDMTEEDTKKLEEYLREDLFEESDSATENESLESMDDDMIEPPADYENIHKKLRKAASRNDWFSAYLEIFGGDGKKISNYATASLTDNQDNALHIAAAAGSSFFIYFLRKYMRKEDLGIKNDEGNTAFYLAAKHGRFKCAELMLDINEKLLWIRGEANMLPIQIAAQKGHIRMVKYLYKVHDGATNSIKLSQEDCEKLLPNLICRADLIVSHKNKRPHEKLPKKALDLLKHLLNKIDPLDAWIDGVINDAVKQENVEFLSLIICEYSELMICPMKGDRKTAGLIFSNAISKHQKDIFQLRESLRPPLKRQILDYKDDRGNNILHFAGKLSPPEQLDAICGVALQLQEELKWFKEVSNMADASKAHEKNNDDKTPKALFDEEHERLKERAERWMKDTANSCMIVATLIATVVFAAAFTVPGGTNGESGMPRFSNQLSFSIFIFADAISLVLSVYTLLIFLAIHTSRYAEKDFLLVLPKKLVVGLLTLWLSIAAMMVVFCTSIFIVFKVDNIWVRILLSVSASLPVLHFAKMKRRLLFDVVHKTSEISSILKEGKRMKGAR